MGTLGDSFGEPGDRAQQLELPLPTGPHGPPPPRTLTGNSRRIQPHCPAQPVRPERGPPDPTDEETAICPDEPNDAFIRRFLAAWERRDTPFIVDSFTDDAVYHSIPLPPIVGKPAIAEFVAGFADVPPGRLEVHHQIADGDIVMNERTDHIVINGRPVVLPICGVFEVDGGRIKAWREYFDLAPARAAYE